MTIALISVIVVAVVVCLSISFSKDKEISSLHAKLNEQHDTNKLRSIEIYEQQQQEKKRRDLIEIQLITELSITKCENIYNQLIDAGLYSEFYDSCTKKEKLKTLKKINF